MKSTTSLLLALLFLVPAIASARDVRPPETEASATIVQEFPLSDYNGIWVLNARLSEDLQTLLGPARAPGGEGGGRGGGSGGGRGGGRGGGAVGGMRGGMGGGMGGGSGGKGGNGAGTRFGGEEQDTGADPFTRQQLRLQKEYSRLEIYLEFPELNLTDGFDIVQLYFLDGRETNVWTQRGEMTARSELKDGKLQVSTAGREPDEARTRTYSLTQDARQLIMDEERLLPGRKEPVTIRRVYDRTLRAVGD